jgi:hypothetical protein
MPEAITGYNRHFAGGAPQYASPEQMAQALRNAGFTESEIPTMLAIGMAESGGATNVYNDYRAWHHGPWQISGIHTGKLQQENPELYDLQNNANMARKIYEKQGLGAWESYTVGTHNQFLNGGQGMVTGNTQPAAPNALAREVQAELKRYRDAIVAEEAKGSDADPVYLKSLRDQVIRLLQIDTSRGDTAAGGMTPAQQAQLGINAAAEQRQATNDYVTNVRNFELDRVARGEITVKDAIANINRYVSGATLAEQQAQNEIANTVKLAEASAYPGQEYYAGFEPGGLVSTLSQNVPWAGGASPGGMRIQTTNVNPQGIRQQALQQFGVEGPLPTIPQRPDVPLTDPRMLPPAPINPGVAAALTASQGFGGGTGPGAPGPMPSDTGSGWTQLPNGQWTATSTLYPEAATIARNHR